MTVSQIKWHIRSMGEREESQVSACTTSVTSKLVFDNYLVPPMQLWNEESECNMRNAEVRKTDQSKEVEDVEVHDLYNAE